MASLPRGWFVVRPNDRYRSDNEDWEVYYDHGKNDDVPWVLVDRTYRVGASKHYVGNFSTLRLAIEAAAAGNDLGRRRGAQRHNPPAKGGDRSYCVRVRKNPEGTIVAETAYKTKAGAMKAGQAAADRCPRGHRVTVDEVVMGVGSPGLKAASRAVGRRITKSRSNPRGNPRRKNTDLPPIERPKKQRYKPGGPLIQREGKLGGPGYTERPARTRHMLLNRSVKTYGYRSTLGSLQVLLRNRDVFSDTARVIESDVAWLKAKHGSSGSVASRRKNPGAPAFKFRVGQVTRPNLSPDDGSMYYEILERVGRWDGPTSALGFGQINGRQVAPGEPLYRVRVHSWKGAGPERMLPQSAMLPRKSSSSARRRNPAQYRVLLGSSQVIDVRSKKEAEDLAKHEQGWIQMWDPEDGWLRVSPRGGPIGPRSTWRVT